MLLPGITQHNNLKIIGVGAGPAAQAQLKLTRMTRMVTVAAATMAGGGKGGLPPPTQC